MSTPGTNGSAAATATARASSAAGGGGSQAAGVTRPVTRARLAAITGGSDSVAYMAALFLFLIHGCLVFEF
jgi:hypothetical protein